jgi:bifunctional DNase/RNase
MADDSDREIEMVVESVRVHMLSSRHVVILKETARDRYLPIWIGPWEASAIAMRLQGLTPERPLTHDLFASALGELGVRVERVVIAALAEETFHARLILRADGRQLEIDSRPSDALALAVRLGTPIFAAPEVLEQAGLGAEAAGEGIEGEGSEEREGAALSDEALEATGERFSDPRLAVFRDFVNSLDQPEGGEQKEGPAPG